MDIVLEIYAYGCATSSISKSDFLRDKMLLLDSPQFKIVLIDHLVNLNSIASIVIIVGI